MKPEGAILDHEEKIMPQLPRIQYTHTGIFCADLDMMVEFYCAKVGFIVSDKGVASTGHRLFFLTQDPEIHHQLVLFDGKPTGLPFNPINQLSFLLDSLDDLKTYYAKALEFGIRNISQVDHGNAWSLYFADPEGNPIEMYVDSPFYTAQPCREPLPHNAGGASRILQVLRLRLRATK